MSDRAFKLGDIVRIANGCDSGDIPRHANGVVLRSGWNKHGKPVTDAVFTWGADLDDIDQECTWTAHDWEFVMVSPHSGASPVASGWLALAREVVRRVPWGRVDLLDVVMGSCVVVVCLLIPLLIWSKTASPEEWRVVECLRASDGTAEALAVCHGGGG